MARRRASTRAAAIRRAHEAKAQRDAERLARERTIEATLADYFEAVDRAAAIRADAQRRADKIVTDADAAVGPSEAASWDALNRLRSLTSSHAEVADLCGLTAAAVRAMLRENAAPPPGASPGPEPSRPAEPDGYPLSPPAASPDG